MPTVSKWSQILKISVLHFTLHDLDHIYFEHLPLSGFASFTAPFYHTQKTTSLCGLLFKCLSYTPDGCYYSTLCVSVCKSAWLAWLYSNKTQTHCQCLIIWWALMGPVTRHHFRLVCFFFSFLVHTHTYTFKKKKMKSGSTKTAIVKVRFNPTLNLYCIVWGCSCDGSSGLVCTVVI